MDLPASMIRVVALCDFRRDSRILVGTGVDEEKGQRFFRPLGGHDAYKEKFGGSGTLTLLVLELEGDYDVVIRHQGPEESVGWLEDAILAAAESAGGRARVTTPVVVGELTDRY